MKPIFVDLGNSMEGIVVFESTESEEIGNEGQEVVGRGQSFVEVEEPSPLNSFHPRVLDWVIQKALDIKHYVGIT